MSQPPRRPTTGQRRALADYLRACRARLTPADAGLADGMPRRTIGLRREEVAVLAGVSITWYTWLEQGRPINPSADVLRALARALRLDADETTYLVALATPTASPPPGHRPAELYELVDHHPCPALLIDRRWDLVAWNRAADAVWGFSAVPVRERNLAVLTFHPFNRAHLVGWAQHARRVVAEVRAGSADLADDPQFAAMLRQLRAHPEVDEWWSAAEVRPRVGAHKEFRHPQAGPLRFHEVILRPATDADLQLTVLMPDRASDTARRLDALIA